MSDRYAAYERLKFDAPADRILRITMDAPGRLNAADETMHDELGRIWKDVEADPDISVAILRGAGDAFSAGGDFDMIDKMIDNFANIREEISPRMTTTPDLLADQGRQIASAEMMILTVDVVTTSSGTSPRRWSPSNVTRYSSR